MCLLDEKRNKLLQTLGSVSAIGRMQRASYEQGITPLDALLVFALVLELVIRACVITHRRCSAVSRSPIRNQDLVLMTGRRFTTIIARYARVIIGLRIIVARRLARYFRSQVAIPGIRRIRRVPSVISLSLSL